MHYGLLLEVGQDRSTEWWWVLVSLYDDCMESKGAWNSGFSGMEGMSFKEKIKDMIL